MRPLNVALAHGVHARPAAAIAACARRFAAEVVLETDGKRADARSVVALMTLGVRKGERVTLKARGVDAAQAAEAIAALLEGGFEEASEPAPPPAPKPPAAENGDDPRLLRGVMGAPGLAVGQAFRFKAAEIAVPTTAADPATERAALAHARGEARARLERAGHGADRNRRDILKAHAAMLDDPDLLARAGREIDEGGQRRARVAPCGPGQRLRARGARRCAS